jgi:hypothetical protein
LKTLTAKDASYGFGRERTLTPSILVRIQVPQPVIRYLITQVLLSLREAYFCAYFPGVTGPAFPSDSWQRRFQGRFRVSQGPPCFIGFEHCARTRARPLVRSSSTTPPHSGSLNGDASISSSHVSSAVDETDIRSIYPDSLSIRRVSGNKWFARGPKLDSAGEHDSGWFSHARRTRTPGASPRRSSGTLQQPAAF